MNINQINSATHFALCVHSDDPDMLTPRMIYEILPDEQAEARQYLRVIDNEGEDYLYPANYFIAVDFPPAIEQALLNIKQNQEQNILAEAVK